MHHIYRARKSVCYSHLFTDSFVVVFPNSNGPLSKSLTGLGAKHELVVQIEFGEWTSYGHLRHSRFVGLCEDNQSSKGEVTH